MVLISQRQLMWSWVRARGSRIAKHTLSHSLLLHCWVRMSLSNFATARLHGLVVGGKDFVDILHLVFAWDF